MYPYRVYVVRDFVECISAMNEITAYSHTLHSDNIDSGRMLLAGENACFELIDLIS